MMIRNVFLILATAGFLGALPTSIAEADNHTTEITVVVKKSSKKIEGIVVQVLCYQKKNKKYILVSTLVEGRTDANGTKVFNKELSPDFRYNAQIRPNQELKGQTKQKKITKAKHKFTIRAKVNN